MAFPRYKGTDGVEAFARSLVEDSGILVLPGSIYQSELGPTPGDRFRIGVGRYGMDEALEAYNHPDVVEALQKAQLEGVKKSPSYFSSTNVVDELSLAES